ncbi:hypothetical protein BTO16_03340 [Polaribacter glomeratus]|uniref:Ig-like domain-containing protein n=1 Tax=Polaribacter glomeratus TaxID=102 RepID=A0A2S7WWB8_9FLAO|nr:hypothetical protein BTO16_03340 [Polaribacter glomeratus]
MWSQSVSVNDETYTANTLVDLLVSNNCVTTSNYQLSSKKSVAYFNNNNSNFPIKEGIILRNGIAKYSEGKFTDDELSSEIVSNSDADLTEISNNSGQNSEIFDVALLSFDFISQSSKFDFNFIFASNEYGEWQCGFSDVFGFILTDISTGEKTNLAILPNSNDIVSVKSIRDTQHNTSCNSVNASLFSTLNTIETANSSSLNMRGYTVILNASAKIETNKKYNLKLVIGDYGDTSFDSAVFIEPGNFNRSFSVGDDFSICQNEPFILNTLVDDTTNFNFEWFKDGALITNENASSYHGTKIGKYKVKATNAEGCSISDEIVISKLNITKEPKDLYECNNGNDTSFNIGQFDIRYFNLDKDRYRLNYYNSIENINANNPINSSDLRYYLSAGNETIYIKVESRLLNELCENLTLSFKLNAIEFKTKKPNDVEVCKSTNTISIPGLINAEILENLNQANYTITFYGSFKDAQNQVLPITNASVYPISDPSKTLIYARSESKFNSSCFDIVQFNVIVFDLPKIDTIKNVIVCENYTLPPIANGNYFTRSNGTGTPLFTGDLLVSNQTIFIYNENENGCSNQSQFTISILDKFILKDNYCEKFTVFNPPNGDFYSASGGKNGGGINIPAGTEIRESKTIYYYATVGEEVCKEKSFDIVIIPRPKVDKLQNIATCTSYTLPELTYGKYFTGSNGNGSELTVGTEISKNQVIYIYNVDRKCESQTSFKVYKIDVNNFKDLKICGTYTLPNLDVGGYFTQPNGLGEKIEEGTVLKTSERIYYYVKTHEINNCTTNLSFKIDIFPIPETDTLEDVVRCVNEPYLLPKLTNGKYFTQSKGKGTELTAGDLISKSAKIFIYNKNNNCDAETSFNIEIRILPRADIFTDVFACKPFVLPVLNNGTYYSESGGQGDQLKAGDIISETKIIYIYSIDTKLEGCVNENIFTVEYLGVEVDKIANVNSCDSYALPALNVGNYFTKRSGKGTKMNAGDIITNNLELYIYAENGSRFFCSDEHLFSIEISKTPTLKDLIDIEKCGSYTLQDISTIVSNKFEYYRKPNKVDLITPQNYTITAVGEHSIYAVESAISNENCYSEKEFKLTIYPLLDLIIEDVFICEDLDTKENKKPVEIKTGLNPVKFSANWFFEGQLVGSGVNYNATKAGTYKIEPIRLVAENGNDCNYKPTEIQVLSSSPKVKITYLSDDFSDKTSVRVDFINYGLGDYEFQLNDGGFQTDAIFTNLETGIYTITIRDTKNICPNIKIKFTALSYPKFFTPNNDGINDFWNIKDLKNNPEAIITIHDRYGLLITQFKASEQGWSGFYKNGKNSLPSSYWFKVNFIFKEELTNFQAYFSLERN